MKSSLSQEKKQRQKYERNVKDLEEELRVSYSPKPDNIVSIFTHTMYMYSTTYQNAHSVLTIFGNFLKCPGVLECIREPV